MTNLNILKIITESIKLKSKTDFDTVNVDILAQFFEELSTSKSKFNSAYLHYFLYHNICKESIAKRKTTSRDLEDVLATIFDGTITDEFKRTNKNDDNWFLENDIVTGSAISNKREKSDIVFDKGENIYEISVKTLMQNNKEINFGSFEKITLFGGFGIEGLLTERGKKKTVGLGSKPQLKALLEKLQENNFYDKFQARFCELVKFVFSEDLIVLVKNKTVMDLYFVKGQDFVDLLCNISNSPQEFITLINRWEGNSIRMDRSKILEIATHIRLDFHFLEDHLVSEIVSLEEKIATYFIKYVNSYPENSQYKELIFAECDKIIGKIDVNINNLL